MSGSDVPVCLVGWGAIGTALARILAERAAPGRIVAVVVRVTNRDRTLPDGARLIAEPSQLQSTGACLLAEAAGRDAVATCCGAALDAGLDVAVSSTSALVDDALFADLRTRATASGARIHIPPGALGGIDAQAAVSRLALGAVTHTVVKPPRAWAGTEAERLCDLAALTARTVFFEGTAREAADRFPQNANVAAISAFAGVGLDATRVVLVADPDATRNGYRLEAEGAFGALRVEIENEPLPENPKTFGMTALNLVRVIENCAGGIVI